MAIVIPHCHSLLSLHPTLPTSHHPSISLYRSLHPPASPSLRLWTKGTFQPHKTSQTEHEMCQYLEWELNVDPVTFREFEDMVKKYLTTPPPTTNPFLPPPATLAPTPIYVASPPTPPGMEDCTAHIVSASSSPGIPKSPPPSSSYITPPTLPSSTASPPTPPGMEDCPARIILALSSPGIPKHKPVRLYR
ncbi:uncharacterized protein F5147DRAFT_772752 [Suillus discolor]|uniref:Uncharacterized protein n=1 Tax=Suillus discolor TaxID=1912936 RepID=A0A9P7JV09_9AGAM|nr:uncharacterized protein F5147DRAFT_772752 [Suillus discolor]KAG2109904.1 hypothetical protein F5147DRAFT_772752 [Suillus discolor]